MLREQLTRFVKKPLPEKLAAIRATLMRRLPFPFEQNIRNYQERKYKERLFGKLSPLVPAVKDMFDGPQDLQVFKDNGEEFLRIYKNICGLRPDEQILDVGCGIGRKTVPLTQYLTNAAAYEGIDITRAGIEWCSKTITPRFPNFTISTTRCL